MKGHCDACGRPGVIDRAHLKSRGAGAGWKDFEWMRLCRIHHVESGAIGWFLFCEKYPRIYEELDKRGFEIVEIFGIKKLRRK